MREHLLLMQSRSVLVKWADWWRTTATLLAPLGILALAVWWDGYKLQDCQAVGHSMLYCVGKIILG